MIPLSHALTHSKLRRALLNKLIADRLGIAEKTVQQHRGTASRKLGVHNAVETSDFLRRLVEEAS